MGASRGADAFIIRAGATPGKGARTVLLLLVLAVAVVNHFRKMPSAPLEIAPVDSSTPRNCTQARFGAGERAQGVSYYAPWLGGDDDGVACEAW